MTNPSPPKALAEVLASKSTTSIGLTWTNGDSDGGAAVTSYTISSSTGGGAFSVVQADVSTNSFTVTGLTTGTTYTFKVQSRNSFDISDYSDGLSILCAFKPIAPLAPTTSVSADKVII